MNKRINISLPTNTLEKLKCEIPAGKLSKFVDQAVKEKLGKRLSIKEETEKSFELNKAINEQARQEWSAVDTEGCP